MGNKVTQIYKDLITQSLVSQMESDTGEQRGMLEELCEIKKHEHGKKWMQGDKLEVAA